MNSKEYFKKHKVILTKQQRQIIKIYGLLTSIELNYKVPIVLIDKLESRIIKLISNK